MGGEMAGGAGGVIRAGQEVILGAGVKAIAKATGRKAVLRAGAVFLKAGRGAGAGRTKREAGVVRETLPSQTSGERAGVTVGVGAEVGVGVRAGVKAGVGVRAKVGVGAEKTKRKRKVRRRFKVLLLRRSRKKLRSLPKTKVCHLLLRRRKWNKTPSPMNVKTLRKTKLTRKRFKNRERLLMLVKKFKTAKLQLKKLIKAC